MVDIKKSAIEKIVGPLNFEGHVSLFVVSKSDPRLKQINLDKLTPEERAAKLRKWGQEQRFVAVIELGDMVFAHAHAKHIGKLETAESLALNGKKVTLKALTDEEAEQLSAVGEAFEEHVLHKNEEEEENQRLEQTTGRVMPRQYYANRQLMTDQMHTHLLIAFMMKNELGKIITRCMEQYNEARREMEKQKEADDKHFDVLRSEIKKGEQRTEIARDEVKRQALKSTLVNQDAQRVNQTRGIEA